MRNPFFFLLISCHLLQAQDTTRYLPLGDSYTICEGLSAAERWPNLVTGMLSSSEHSVILADNPARTGYTTADLIRYEMPVYKKQKPDVVTLLIGVNDYVRGKDSTYFRTQLNTILDQLTAVNPSVKILLITIPDYSITPGGSAYTGGRDVHHDLILWNGIIRQTGRNRNIPVADIFEVSMQMLYNPAMTGTDGLHPSAQMVAQWALIIRPVLEDLLK